MKSGFWFYLTLAVIAWYGTITVYVAIKGGMDIKSMLRRIGKQGESGEM